MRKETFKNYKRVSKRTAEKAYNAGKQIIIAPCNANMYFMVPLYAIIDKSNDDEWTDFIKHVNAFEYYNCNNELGKYAKYFIESEV